MGRDFYATPAWVTEALLQHVRFRGPVWEPCCGDGAMSSVLTEQGYDVVSTDLVDRGFGKPGVDFLACRSVPGRCQSIVTNPPYGDSGSHAGQSRSPTAMLDFLRHAMMLTKSVQGQLALLVRLQWIAGQRVAEIMSDGPFAAVVVLRGASNGSTWASTPKPRSITTPGSFSTTLTPPGGRRRCFTHNARSLIRRSSPSIWPVIS